MSDSFIHLHVHTEYSIVDGIIRLDELMAQLVKFSMPAVAITDYMNLFAAIKFYKLAIKYGIKPIIGCEVEIAEHKNATKTFKAVLLCQNEIGYMNLKHLISMAYLEQDVFGKKRVLKENIEKNANGLIMLSGATEGDVGEALKSDDYTLALKHLERWKKCFGDRYYIEVQRSQKTNDEKYINHAKKICLETSTPIVATNNVVFLNENDFEAHEARVCIQEGSLLSESSKNRKYAMSQYLKSQKEMLKLFRDIPDALINSVNIAKRCSLQLRLNEVALPDFPVPPQFTIESFLKAESLKGLYARLDEQLDITDKDIENKKQNYEKRLFAELEVIIKMGFSGYFLIVYDFIQWAKKNAIPVGPGRGSGAGSLVAYSLGITDLDPTKYDLIFERFLNTERVSMPDFDIDFCIDGRDKVIDYVKEKYGKDNVAQIITFGTMAARAVVRDVGRVLGYPYGFVDKIAKLIPFELGIKLSKALEEDGELNRRYQTEDDVKSILDLAIKLEGIIRNAGKHAGGVVIAPSTIINFAPIYRESNEDSPVTQFDKYDVESVGLVKFDFLGLKTLTIINNAANIVNKLLKEENKEIKINLIPTDDQKTFDLIRSCNTSAVFQLESRVMRDLIRRLQPDCFEDLLALLALVRPGPQQSGMVEDYISRKHGLTKVEYIHPALEPILSNTYGVILFQEQVMEVARSIGGYTLGKADLLRSAMGKKKPEEMAKHREIFVSGAIDNGLSQTTAIHLFDLMEKFSGYGFNKSHSAAYALISYQTAWLKANYPAPFMAAVLTAEMENSDKISNLVSECRQILNITVLAPNINRSVYEFTVENKNTINFGLGALKGVGKAAIESLIQVRNKVGIFTSLIHFFTHIDIKRINKRCIESLIYAGAFDTLGEPRTKCIAQLQNYLAYSEQNLNNVESGQIDLFKTSQDSFQVSKAENEIKASITQLEILKFEKFALGFYLNVHPLDYYKNDLISMNISSLKQINDYPTSGEVIISGLITGIRKAKTRRGDRMYFITLDDSTAQLDAIMFEDSYQKVSEIIDKDQVVICKCLLNKDDQGAIRVRIFDLNSIEYLRKKCCEGIEISLSHNASGPESLKKLQHLVINQEKGTCNIYCLYNTDKIQGRIMLNKEWRVNPTDYFILELYQIFGDQNVHLHYENILNELR